MLRSRALAAVVAGALSLGLVGCTPEPMPVPTPTPSETAAPTGDGVLRIGTLFPTTGSTAFIAKAQDAGVELLAVSLDQSARQASDMTKD